MDLSLFSLMRKRAAQIGPVKENFSGSLSPFRACCRYTDKCFKEGEMNDEKNDQSNRRICAH